MNTSPANFNENGFAQFKSVLTESEVQSFRNECIKLVDLPVDTSHGDNDYIKANIFMRSPAITEIFFQDKVIDAIKEVCGPSFYILPEISVMKSQYGGWHKDTTSIELFGQNFHKKDDFRIVNVAIYCQDNTDLGGGLDVVPGSHKTDDPFVEHFKKVAEEAEKNKAGENRSITKRAIDKLGSVLGLKKDAEPKRVNKGGISYPLDSSDKRPGKFRIGTTKGDVVIFDLRLDHKASWPKREFDPSSVPSKYAFFAICGANNETTLDYVKYLHKRAETQQSYKYLNTYQPSPELKKTATDKGVQLL